MLAQPMNDKVLEMLVRRGKKFESIALGKRIDKKSLVIPLMIVIDSPLYLFVLSEHHYQQYAGYMRDNGERIYSRLMDELW